MATVAFGQLDSWESEVSGKGSSKEDYLNLRTDGKYVLRFITNPPFKFMAHWLEIRGKKHKINCAGRDCILCKGGSEAGTFYVSIVYNRDLDRCQVFEFKRSVFDQIKGHHTNRHWGNLINYDVEVDRKVSRKFKTYETTPLPKEPLTKEQLAMIAEFSQRINLDRHCAAMDNESIEKKLAELGETSFSTGAPSGTTTARSAQPVVDEDPDFSFN